VEHPISCACEGDDGVRFRGLKPEQVFCGWVKDGVAERALLVKMAVVLANLAKTAFSCITLVWLNDRGVDVY